MPDGVTRITSDYNNTHFTRPLLMANGTYAFQRKDRVDDGKDTGVANAAMGIPMPSNPEMGAFWSDMQPALTNITTGAQAPDVALQDVAKRILGGS